MAEFKLDAPLAALPQPKFLDRLLAHVRSKEFANEADIVASIHEFSTLSKKAAAPLQVFPADVIPFGKYKGHKLVDVNASDSQYLRWLCTQQYITKFPELCQQLRTRGYNAPHAPPSAM